MRLGDGMDDATFQSLGGMRERMMSQMSRCPMRELRTARRMPAGISSWAAAEPTIILKIARWRTSSVIYSLGKSMGIGGPGGTMQLRSSSSGERTMSLSLLMSANLALLQLDGGRHRNRQG